MKKLCDAFQTFRADQRGNVLMIFGFALVPMVYATGMGIDYARAMKAQTKLDAAADAAALAAVTQTMMTQTNAMACETARKMFEGQAASVNDVVLNLDDPQQFSITLEDNDGEVIDCDSSSSSLTSTASFGRTATVTYRGLSNNVFSGILGMQTLTISGTSQSFAAVAPDIDFYLLVDMSQSMLLPATSSGLAAMIKATKAQGGGEGCAFACHQTETRPSKGAGEIKSNPLMEGEPNNNDGRRIDNYAVALKEGIVLRTDVVKEAIADLAGEATKSSTDNKATYRMGLAIFDNNFTMKWPATGNRANKATYFVDDDLETIAEYARGLMPEAYYLNNHIKEGVKDNDTHTRFSDAFLGIMEKMPSQAGTGEKTGNPQAIMFLITDGMWDRRRSTSWPEGPIYNYKSGANYIADTSGANRVQFCDDVKARNIRIAVLYTEYLPSSASDKWSRDNVRDRHLQPTDKVAQALEKCASSGLYYKVTTDDDVSKALKTLFNKAVSTARLTR